ncbi:MAG: hypothetical protein ACREF0_13110 [Acetobacteraceae bacterium]
MITLEHDSLVFRFPDVHADAEFTVSLIRTLRIPDDGRDHPLPPGLGHFALRHIDDCARHLPDHMTERGGVIVPMYQAEAMWLNFQPAWGFAYPFALKIGAGKINAVTGAGWTNTLSGDPQDYVVIPGQPWLDGYCVEKGVIRQFVAAPFDRGVTVEEQLTGESGWGGVQLLAFPMKLEQALELRTAWERKRRHLVLHEAPAFHEFPLRADLGLAAGGRMRQAIAIDPYGIDAWDQEQSSRCFVTILESHAWTAITGEAMPSKPIDAAHYTKAGLPWFDYQTDQPAVSGSKVLAGIKSIAQAWKSPPAPFEASVPPPRVESLGFRQVKEMRG